MRLLGYSVLASLFLAAQSGANSEQPPNVILVAYDLPVVKGGYAPNAVNVVEHRKGQVVLEIRDILAYDPQLHIARISRTGEERVKKACKNGKVAVFYADGVPCYLAECWVRILSGGGEQASVVRLDTEHENEANFAVLLARQFAESPHQNGDPRDHAKLLSWLDKHHKLTPSNNTRGKEPPSPNLDEAPSPKKP